MLIRQAGDRGQLYGSVTPARYRRRRWKRAASRSTVTRCTISVAIKSIGLFTIPVVLHPEVKVNITINVARSEDEAERQARGENVLAEKTEAEEAKVAAEELFEEGAGPKAEAPRKKPPKPDRFDIEMKKAGRKTGPFFLRRALRAIQFTPPGSPCSIHFGKGLTSAAPGSAGPLFLVVSDIEAARTALTAQGAAVSDVFHHAAPGQPPAQGPRSRKTQLRLLRHIQRPGRQ